MELSNHQLLMVLGPYSTWFFVPTRREERRLAYDASLQGQKALVLQYKRFRPGRKFGKGSISINPKQHEALTKNFPRMGVPYVFYAVCIEPTYKHLNSYFQRDRGFALGRRILFIDAHTIAAETTCVSLQWPVRVILRKSGKRVAVGLLPRTLLALARDFLSCHSGLRGDLAAEIGPVDQRVMRTPLPHLHILWSKVPPT